MASNSRRGFLRQLSLGAGILGASSALGADKPIQGFDETDANAKKDAVWQPFSDRKVRVGIVGYGVCRFGASFGFQNHPNVEIVAVSDLIPENCAALSKAVNCATTYPSLEELIKDDNIEAVFVATDAPSHAQHCMAVMNSGKHVACAVPSTYGSLEEADQLFETVKRTGMNYMLFETSAYRADCYAMRKIFESGDFGRMVYTEGEYYHYMVVSWDTPGYHGEVGRVRGDKGSMIGTAFQGLTEIPAASLAKPALPPGMPAGGHGGSHGYLTEEFIHSILQDRKPLVDIAWGLNMTVAGIVAHQSAMKDGETLKIPQYSFA